MANVAPLDAATAELRSRIAAYPWHHSIDLGGGVVTAGGKPLPLCQEEASRIFDRVNLEGRSVLDIGAWNGYFSFDAKQRGAHTVLATDSYCWSHPHIKGRETFDIARAALGLDVAAREIDVTDLSPESVGLFDVVLYLGVFYHRYDAIEALARVAKLAKELLIVETHLELRELDLPAMVFFPGKELANDPTNWWGPNEHLVKDLLLGHGFSEVEMTAHPAGTNRAIFHAWRTIEGRVRPVGADKILKPIGEATRARQLPVIRKLKRFLDWVNPGG